ncbi:MAG: extracellular solute-binding protein [Proteobacteria bacterium]|nr:extracellular solute-binding protein [Pseudomonadota bacterium]
MKRDVALRLLCWEGYDRPEILDPFIRSHGAKVVAETLLADYDAALRIVRSPRRWDIVNLNSPFARDLLHPQGLVRPLERTRFDPFFADMLPWLGPCYRSAYSRDGAALLGVCQRFGPLNFVINADRTSPATAADQGFDLANDPTNAGRYGILSYDDFNVFHIAIGAGLDPFVRLTEAELTAFAATARRWFAAAALVSNEHSMLNRALVAGEIDFYISGGVYTASPARLAGHGNVRAVTPMRGPIGGKGGIIFLEVTSVLEQAATPVLAADFLAYLMQPETAVRAALSAGACNPVTQLSDPTVFGAFTADQLKAMQWDDLQEQVARCAEYALAPDYERLQALLISARRERDST